MATQLRVGSVSLVLLFATACSDDAPSPGPSVRPGAPFTITTDNGVRLRALDTDRVAVDGRVRIAWSPAGDAVTLTCPDQGPCDRMPVVTVPRGASVTVSARNAGIEAAGPTGPLDLATVNGDVVLTGSGTAPVTLTSQNGSIRASAQRAGSFTAATVNGDITLAWTGAPPSRLTATTTNGSVRVALPHDPPPYAVTATTSHGRTAITVPTSPGAPHLLTLQTVNGDLTATS